MKTIADLEEMKSRSSSLFNNAYEYFFELLRDFYISKIDGKERIKHELNNWDNEAQKYIINVLIVKIGQDLMDFDPTDLLQLIN